MNSDDADNTEDKKRDWKDMKKETEETDLNMEKTEDGKMEDAEEKIDKPVIMEDTVPKETKEASEKNEKDNAKTTGKKSEARHAESRYAEVPMSHMFCHICNKHMWDGFVCIINKIDESV
jgi:hypothetical protein